MAQAMVLDREYLLEKWAQKKNTAHFCLMELSEKMHIKGVEKLVRCIQKDLKVLNNMTAENMIHVASSNVSRFGALVRCMNLQSDVRAVLEPFKIRVNGQVIKSLYVDIVCNLLTQEALWIKVISKNRQSLTSASLGDCEFGRKNILDHAGDYIEAALQNKHNFKAPKIIFHFDAGIDSCLADAITNLGIEVTGQVEFSNVIENGGTNGDSNSNDIDEVSSTPEPNAQQKEPDIIRKLNLDVCAMIGYVSDLTNGGSNLVCTNKVLNLQAQAEKKSPLLSVLDELFEGKELLCCTSALDAFMSIVNLLGGPKEKERAAEFVKRLTVVADTDRPITLSFNKRITKRSAIIFMTGEDHKAITVTANNCLPKAAAVQGQNFPVFIHQARSLTEMKNIAVSGSEPEATD